MSSTRERLTDQAYLEARAMAAHALGNGLALPPGVIAAITRLSPDAEGAAPALPLREIARVHGELARVVAPASPELILALHQDGAARGRQANGQLAVVRSFMVAAVVSLAVFIGVSLSPEINNPSLGDFFSSWGLPLLVNEAFYLSAAAVGASFSSLFRVSREIDAGTFVPRLGFTAWVQFVLGVVSGFLMATVLNINTLAPADKAGPTRLVFSGALLALLGGLSGSVVERLLGRMNEALETILSGSADQEVAVRRKMAKLRRDEAVARERGRSDLLLQDIQRRAAAGESPESLLATLDQASRAALSPDEPPPPAPAKRAPPPARPSTLPAAPPAKAPPPPAPQVADVAAAFELRAVVEAGDGTPLAEASYEILSEGKVVASGRTDATGAIVQAVPGDGDYEIVLYGEEAAPQDLAAARALAAWHAARVELARGLEIHGPGKTWETAGSNRGPLVDQYVEPFMSPSAAPPWCGMFVGYCYLGAGFRTAGTLPAGQTTDGAGAPRRTMFMSATRLMLYFKGASRPHVEMPARGSAPATAATCAAWLDANLAGFAPRPGDILLLRSGSKDYAHVGMVAAYDPATHALVTYEGNFGNRAGAWSWDLSDPGESGFSRVNMIGRLAPDDFDAAAPPSTAGPSPEPSVERGAAGATA